MTGIDAERYDRQLRLWGTDGQLKLSSATVLCFGSSAAACEVLKNLILPGLGSVIVVDDALTRERDLGSNFFLDSSHLGLNRAKAVVQYLSELNPTVRCVGYSSVSEIPPDVNAHVVVLVNGWIKNYMAKDTVDKSYYTIAVESVGFLGRVCIYATKPHVVLEPKSEEGRLGDLFIAHPWLALRDYIDSFDFSPNAVEIELFHIPWLVILAKACMTTSARDRKSLLSAIVSLENGRLGGLNFDEARHSVFRLTALAWDDEILSDIARIISEYGNDPTRTVDDLVGVLKAVEIFHKRRGSLPLSGPTIPDMVSTTDSYTELVDLFRTKFDADVTEIVALCAAERPIVEKVVTNLRNLTVMEFERMYEGLNDSAHSPDAKRHNGDDVAMEESCFDDPEQEEIVRLLDGLPVDEASLMKQEFDRYSGGVELHAVSAVVGSVAAQEIVKLVTNQFVPIQKSFVFNGINGSGFTY